MSAGNLTLEQLTDAAHRGEIETVIVAFPDLYGRLLGKRYDVDFFLSQVAESGTHGCDYLLTIDMEMNPTPGFDYANWDKGYGDFHLVPDFTTLRRADWAERSALVICDVHDEQTHARVDLAPRSLLRGQLEQAGAAGFEAMAGSELEYFLFRTSYREAQTYGFQEDRLPRAGWYLEDYHLLQTAREEDFHGPARRHLKRSGIPVECTKGEWGEGQHELNIRYADVLSMADRHVVLKQCLKELADAQGASVTFMAKYSSRHAGSSCHLHVSLWRGKENAFAGEDAWEGLSCSAVFRHFLAGWMAHVPELMAFYAPTVNSYKRYLADSWAPTRIAWSRDNRTAGFRVVGSGASLRIECRIPGADCNPYLAYAAALASGLDGIRRELEPPPARRGNIYRSETDDAPPRSLREAADQLAGSTFARQTFGDAAVDHYAHFFHVEQQAYDEAVTDWERQRYFERI